MRLPPGVVEPSNGNLAFHCRTGRERNEQGRGAPGAPAAQLASIAIVEGVVISNHLRLWSSVLPFATPG